jgi:hypothetical protein
MTARQKAERGIKASADNAGREWQDQAVAAARLFVRWNDRVYGGLEFSIEMLRLWCSQRIDAPPDQRAWGAVTRRLKAEKIIRPTGGYLMAASSNLSPKSSYVRYRPTNQGGRQ